MEQGSEPAVINEVRWQQVFLFPCVERFCKLLSFEVDRAILFAFIGADDIDKSQPFQDEDNS